MVLAILHMGILVNEVFSAQLIPARLRCESRDEPLGIDVEKPRLSWNFHPADPAARGLRQAAYQIHVASSAANLDADKADLWNSGWVESADSIGITYGGTELTSGKTVHWKVRARDAGGETSAWSTPGTWTMGQLASADWEPARWISSIPESASPAAAVSTIARGKAAKQPASMIARREFNCADRIVRAVVFVSGLGHYELSINGAKVGDELLAPGWTNYRKTVLYETFDVTRQLQSGANAIALILGNGMYHIEPTRGRYVKFTNSFGPQKAILKLQIEYASGQKQTIVTDRNWLVSPGPISYSNQFGGEDFDGRFPAGWDKPGFTTSNSAPQHAWTNASEVGGPGGSLRGLSAAAPPIKAIETRRPVSEKALTKHITVYDLGQNASVMPRLSVRGQAGSYVRAIPSELLGKDGYVDRASSVQDAGGPAWWQYTLAGVGAEQYFPKFFYQGCRYLQVERFAATPDGELPTVTSLEGVVVHSSAEPIGQFQCSNELFNKIYALVRWAQRSNMMSLMTDCPQREKLGWLEELHQNGPALRYNYRLDNLFAKQMNDMADSQLDNGLVPNIAPEYFIASTEKLDDAFRNSPEWGSAFVIVPWQQYLMTGDTSLLERHYPAMVRYVDFLASTAKDDILMRGLGDWYDLGPKPPWGSQLTPPPFTATAIYHYDHSILAQTATLLGKPDDAARFRERAERIRTAFIKRFYDPATARFATGSQCTSAMPLVLGLIEPDQRDAVLKTLIDDIRARGNALSAGDVGYRYVLRALSDAGRSDVVFEMNNQTERPGYGMQIMKGATSLTEKWDASVGSFGSQNHFMLGQINEWLFHDLAGIQTDESMPGFEKIVIKPSIVGDITWVKCSYDSPRGKIEVAWRSDGAKRTLDVTIPANTSATVYVPATKPSTVTESGAAPSEAKGVKHLQDVPGYSVFAVGSGVYQFAAE
ncbi:MAG: family 78 glycoside hydrolase catalytic domain [Burkholderiales bacterium]|nr:family 78 glycoside hydrolase catalytic domain [Phycisphaerae bacterium]